MSRRELCKCWYIHKLPPNLKKNPLQHSVEAVTATSQKESPPKFCRGSSRHISKRIPYKILWRWFQKFCGGSSRHISKRIHSKILRRQFPPHLKKSSSRHISKRIHSKILWRQFPPHLKKNPLQNFLEAVPATSQKESAPKF